MAVAVTLGLVLVDAGGLVVRWLGNNGRTTVGVTFLAFIFGRVVQDGPYIGFVAQLLDFGPDGIGIFARTKVPVEGMTKDGVGQRVSKRHAAHVDQTSSVVDDWLDLAGGIHQYRTEKFRRTFGTMGRMGRIEIERCGLFLRFGWG